MGNETRRILDLLAQGKVTADEAEQLLSALQQQDAPATDAAPPPADPANKKQPKWLRVVVHRQRRIWDDVASAWRYPADIPGATETGEYGKRKGEVNVRIPLALVRAGMKLGAIVPGMAGHQVNQRLREHGIDLSKIDPEHIEDVIKEMGEMTVDVDDGKHQVRIFCE
jgi:hypothetical protein